MLTADDVRRIALSMPQAYEEAHFDIPSFRVNKRIFCTIHTGRDRIMLKLDPEDQHNLSDGEAIVPVDGYWGRNGSTLVYYEKLEPGRLPDLMRMAWANVAPKKLLKAAG